MIDSMDFDTTPYAETCVQVGHENSQEISRIECKALIAQICRQNAKYEDLNFRIKLCPHDFGSYTQIEVKYRSESKAEELVFELESDFPEFWDNEAKEYLRANLPSDYLATLEFAEQD